MGEQVPIRIVSDPAEAEAYSEPPVSGDSDSAIAVIFPSREFRGLKNVVERMRSVDEWMHITTRRGRDASHDAACEIDGGDAAELQLHVAKPEHVSIKTMYTHLGVPTAMGEGGEEGASSSSPLATGGGGAGEGADRADGSMDALTGDAHGSTSEAGGRCEEASACVDARVFLKVLASLNASDLRISNAIFCVVPRRLVILKIYLQDETASSFMIYYLPVRAGEDD